MISLPLTLGTVSTRRTCLLKFLVVDTPSAYNAILGRPTLNTFQAIMSTYHMKIKFHTIGGVGEVQGDPLQSRKCYVEVVHKWKNRNKEVCKEYALENKEKMTDGWRKLQEPRGHPQGATYQRLVDKIFRPQIGRNVEVCVDDIGIEANPLKIKAILDMKAPTIVNEVQKLTGKIAALSHFISKAAEKLYLSSSRRTVHSHRENGSSIGNHSQMIAPLFPLAPYRGKDEHAFEANFRKVRYLQTTEMAGAPMEDAPKAEKASNNEAEYEALVIGMRMAHDVGARHLVAYSDSQLVVKQVEDTYEAKEENMIHYLQEIAELKTRLPRELISANGKQFQGQEYENGVKENFDLIEEPREKAFIRYRNTGTP
ncbi:UNVERIFIED_CONTAM: hypothetical protein Scaly_2824000 [Sesamum calycinum]|uniref:RNase H type-1 domain-containing protein n=1 Tax=Sesamum calycinum TaxID=2727403 RepID=A0AAW2IUU1_9LAMI